MNILNIPSKHEFAPPKKILHQNKLIFNSISHKHFEVPTYSLGYHGIYNLDSRQIDQWLHAEYQR